MVRVAGVPRVIQWARVVMAWFGLGRLPGSSAMTMENTMSDTNPTRVPDTKPEAAGTDPSTWRNLGRVVGAASVAFWLYTFYGIAQAPVGDGSGFQWLAVMPLGMIFFFITVPALILSSFRKTAQAGAILGGVGLVLFLLLWAQLLKELYH
jgi:hypothetical protein